MDFTEKCNNALCAIYADVGEDVTKLIVVDALLNQLGCSIDELMAIADYLEGERYIMWYRAIDGGVIALTGKGVM